MKEYHILIACGSGIATSTVIANRVKNLCEDNGFKVKVQQVEKMASEFDLIVASTRVPETVTTPSVFAINYLTGIKPEAVDEQILKVLRDLGE